MNTLTIAHLDTYARVYALTIAHLDTYVCMRALTTAHLEFHNVGSRDQTEVIGVGGKHLHWLVFNCRTFP